MTGKTAQSNQIKTIYVGGICRLTNEERLKEHFEKYASVESVEILKDEFGESRGFGFLVLSNDTHLRSITQNIHILDGKQLDVKIAKPLVDWGNQDNLSTRWGTGASSIRINRLHDDVSEKEIQQALAPYGQIGSISLLKSENGAKYCFVDFDRIADPDRLLGEPIYIHGRRVNISTFVPNKSKRKKTFIRPNC